MQVLFAFMWTTMPFAVLALLSHFRLRRPFDNSHYYVSWVSGIASAYATAFILGFIIHIPRGGGANFGVAFFPFWAGMSMPLAYWIGGTMGGNFYSLYLFLKKINKKE